MKKIILIVGMITVCSYVQAQEISQELKSLENSASSEVKTEVKAEENKAMQTSLTQLINGIKSSSLMSGSTTSGFLSKLSTATNASGYGSVLTSLANSITPASFGSGWAKVKAGFTDKGTKAKSLSDVASLAGQLVNNLKPGAFTSSFNKTSLLNALSLIK